MKKISILFFSLLAVLMFTACNNDDDPENIETYSPAINSRAINGDKVVFSQNTSIIEVNLTKMTVTINSSYKDCDGNSHKLNTSAMQLTQVSGYTFSFNSGSTAFGEATNGQWHRQYCLHHPPDLQLRNHYRHRSRQRQPKQLYQFAIWIYD